MKRLIKRPFYRFKLKNKKVFCCLDFRRLILDYEFPVVYIPSERLFCLLDEPLGYTIKKDILMVGYDIYFCPYCRNELPSDLIEERYLLLKNIFGEKDFIEDEHDIPSEFLSDEWWTSGKFKYKELSVLEKIRLGVEDDFEGEDPEKIEEEFEKELARQNSKKWKEAADLKIACCRAMNYKIQNCQDGQEKCNCSQAFPMQYEKNTRNFKLFSVTPNFYKWDYIKNRKTRFLSWNIYFCPWCGKKFPKSLSREWYEIVSKDFGVNNIKDKKQLAKVPKEFMTDKWWKDRGL